jgi:hypothetical protein
VGEDWLDGHGLDSAREAEEETAAWLGLGFSLRAGRLSSFAFPFRC